MNSNDQEYAVNKLEKIQFQNVFYFHKTWKKNLSPFKYHRTLHLKW